MKPLWLLCVLSLCVATTSNAQQITNWVVPGNNPFVGSPEVACNLHAARGTISVEDCLAGVAKHQSGSCQSIYLSDGWVMDVTFTINGHHGVQRKVVAFGSTVGTSSATRMAVECTTPSGKSVVFPQVCGNWSILLERKSAYNQGGVTTRTYHSGQTVIVPTLDVCGCVKIPGTIVQIPGFVQQSTKLDY